MTRRILQSIALDKIAVVDKPCQEHAVVSIMKRADHHPLADRIVKEMLALGGDDLNASWSDVVGRLWVKRAQKPAGEELYASLLQIDPRGPDKPDEIYKAVGEFIDGNPELVPQLEKALSDYRLFKVRNTVVGMSFVLGEMRKRQHVNVEIVNNSPGTIAVTKDLEKGHYYVGLKHPEEGIKHFTVEAGNRRGARGKAMRAHGDGHTIFRVHERKPPTVAKAWSDAARAAAAEAHHRAALHVNQKSKVEAHIARGSASKANNPKTRAAEDYLNNMARRGHARTLPKHDEAIAHYKQAAQHFEAGDPKSVSMGARSMARGEKAGGKLGYFATSGEKLRDLVTLRPERAYNMSMEHKYQKRSYADDVDNVRQRGSKGHRVGTGAPNADERGISKAWTDEARRASAEARARHHDAQANAHHAAADKMRAEGTHLGRMQREGKGPSIDGRVLTADYRAHHRAALNHANAAHRFDQASLSYERAAAGNKTHTLNSGRTVDGSAFGDMRYRQGERYANVATRFEHRIAKTKFGQVRRTRAERLADLAANGPLVSVSGGGPRMQLAPLVTRMGKQISKRLATRTPLDKAVSQRFGLSKQRVPGGREEPKPKSLGLRGKGPHRGVGPNPEARRLAQMGTQRANRGLSSPQTARTSSASRKEMLVAKLKPRPLTKDIRLAKLAKAAGLGVMALQSALDFAKKLPADAKAADYIHDFVNSDNPRFKDKSQADRIRMALGAFYGRK